MGHVCRHRLRSSVREGPAQDGEAIGDRPVVDPPASFLPFDQTRLVEHLEVVADGRLGNADWLNQVAGGAGLAFAGDEAEQTQSGRIPQDPEPSGELGRLGFIEGFLDERDAALNYALHDPMIPHIDGHRCESRFSTAGDVANCRSGKEVMVEKRLTEFSHGSG